MRRIGLTAALQSSRLPPEARPGPRPASYLVGGRRVVLTSRFNESREDRRPQVGGHYHRAGLRATPVARTPRAAASILTVERFGSLDSLSTTRHQPAFGPLVAQDHVLFVNTLTST